MRSILKPKKWRRDEERGFALTVNESNTIAINIAKGDENVGREDKDPKTSSGKGIKTEEAINANQLSFGFIPPVADATASRQTWYLLYNRRNGKMFSELSLPVGLADTKQISEWRERIILPDLPDDEAYVDSLPPDDDGFEIKIFKKK